MKTKMTSPERVKAFFANAEPDRALRRFSGHWVSGDIMNSTGAFTGMEGMLLGLIEGHDASLDFIDRCFGVQAGIFERMIDAADGRADCI